MAKKTRKSTPTKKEAMEQPVEESSDIPESAMAKYKDESNVFNTPIEDGKDYINRIPSEMLDRILGYCVMDHEPELAVRQKEQGDNFVKRPHVLLSLAAMSKLFRDHVEVFCRVELTRNKEKYLFMTTAEIVDKGNLRRSPRIKTKPSIDPRCYRMELVKFLQTRCIHCRYWTDHFAPMANAVKCHIACERHAFPKTIDLTAALRNYDLRDWMLLKTRKPGPRTKNIDLPTIPYATVRCGTPLFLGLVVAHRFYEKHVKMIANIVHANVDEHMAAKSKQRDQRAKKRRRLAHRELKIRYHSDALDWLFEDGGDDEEHEYNRERLAHYSSPDWDPDGDSDEDEPDYMYGPYEDVHSRLCTEKNDCEVCWDNAMRKYHEWWL